MLFRRAALSGKCQVAVNGDSVKGLYLCQK